MKKTARLLALFTVVAVPVTAPPAQAAVCTPDDVPAATLLLPYFEVDLDRPEGRTTLMSVVNAGAAARLAHVVVWTDLGVPTLAFDVYLTGFGVQTLNLRDLFSGHLPQTADLAHDPGDLLSPRGRFSEDAIFAGCDGLLPPAPPSAVFLRHLRAAHTGLGSPLWSGQCGGQRFPDGFARGYVTVDVARRCSVLTPEDPGYFGTEGVAGMDNVLFGDFFYIDPEENLSEGNALIPVEAEAGRFGPGDLTFYRRYVGGSGADGREPLSTRWAVRYLSGGAFSGGTDLLYWREVGEVGQPFACGHPPAWYPNSQRELQIFDEQEHPVAIHLFPVPNPPPPRFPFPAAAGRTAVNGPDLPVPYFFGWLFLDLNPAPLYGTPFTQSWVGSVHKALGHFSVGLAATALDSGCSPGTQSLQ